MRPVARARDESGFGMLELLIAMVVLNVGLFALVGAFNASTVAIRRAGDKAAATAVADKQMEVYRGLGSCAIWLDSVLMPAAGSTYALDTQSFNGTATSSPQVAYWNSGASANSQYWATDGVTTANVAGQTNLASCAWKAQGSANAYALPLTATTGANNATTGIDSLGLVHHLRAADERRVREAGHGRGLRPAQHGESARARDLRVRPDCSSVVQDEGSAGVMTRIAMARGLTPRVSGATSGTR